MKKILVVLAMSAVLGSLGPLASAASFLTTTTLSASITATATSFLVASATNIAAGGGLYIDHEYMPVVSVSSTNVTVLRNQRPIAHASGTVVYIATVAQRTSGMAPSAAARRAGQCSTSTSDLYSTAVANIAVLPIIDVETGNMYDCRRYATGWLWMFTNSQTVNSVAGSSPTSWP